MNDVGTIRLETERLILRRFEDSDAEGMYNNWATDSNTCKYLSWDVHENLELTKTIIETWVKEYETGSYNWVVELKDTNEIIGSISAVKVNKKHSNVELGYCYGSKYWGKGYASEALRCVIEFFINVCNIHLVEAFYISGNPASGRVMEKAGMKRDAILRDRRINKDTKELNDLIVYSITKDDLNRS